LGGAVGALLASAGCALQGLLRNPLGDPYLLGVSGGAALGSALGLLLGVAQPPAAMLGAFLALAAVLVLSRGGGAPSATLMVLAGAALHAFTSSILTFILSQARREEGAGILFWLVGQFGIAFLWAASCRSCRLAMLVLGGPDCHRAGLKFIVVGGRNSGGAWVVHEQVSLGGGPPVRGGHGVGGDVEWGDPLCGVWWFPMRRGFWWV
jgi:ABC-type enterobactin transport system permease subunit